MRSEKGVPNSYQFWSQMTSLLKYLLICMKVSMRSKGYNENLEFTLVLDSAIPILNPCLVPQGEVDP